MSELQDAYDEIRRLVGEKAYQQGLLSRALKRIEYLNRVRDAGILANRAMRDQVDAAERERRDAEAEAETLKYELQQFPGALSLEFRKPKSAEDFAVHAITSLVVAELHEAFEFTHLDGQRLADPHPDHRPNGSCDVWDWCRDRVMRLVRDYMRRYPVKAEGPSPEASA